MSLAAADVVGSIHRVKTKTVCEEDIVLPVSPAIRRLRSFLVISIDLGAVTPASRFGDGDAAFRLRAEMPLLFSLRSIAGGERSTDFHLVDLNPRRL